MEVSSIPLLANLETCWPAFCLDLWSIWKDVAAA